MSKRIAKMFAVAAVTAAALLEGSELTLPARSQTVGSAVGSPKGLVCESLTEPMGMDAAHPRLSWKLTDNRRGARQTAYEIQVASSKAKLAGGQADVWESGKVESGASLNIPYAGPGLAASRRYYWRVQAWDQDGKPYPPSEISWWETGLLGQENWKGKWIGYEEPELHRVREGGAMWITNPETNAPELNGDSHHNFRFAFELSKGARRAALYVTGRDTAGAWVNGKQVLQPQPLPPWRQMPWKTYTVRDVTRELQAGKNILAVDIIHYAGERRRGVNDDSQTPMSATLYVEGADGSTEIFVSGTRGWKAKLDASGDWQDAAFDDGSWKEAIPYVTPANSFESGEIGDPWPTGAVKSLRRTFAIAKPIASARVYATALGAYSLMVNGKEVGDQILAPGWTDFRQRVIYQTYDVTNDLKTGKNAIAALLAPGWYSTPLQWYGQGNNYGKTQPVLRAQLRVEYKDGSVEWVLTDERWKADASAISSAEIYDGESYDARKTQQGWDTASFDEGKWKQAEVVQPHEPEIVWQYFPPIRAHQVLEAKNVTSPAAGVYIYDFGQNLAGVARLRARGSAGTNVKLRFAEVLNPDGTLYVENLRTAKATDHFVLSGSGTEEFEPKFTFHGFRYVEVTGVGAKPEPGDVKAVVFHSDAPFTADLKTGSKMLNRLWSNILWGQRSNFVGVPTDCPQRDERLGWTADAQVFWRTATYNMDLATFSRKFSADMRGTQVGTAMYGIFAPGTSTPSPGYGTGWSDAGVIIPWTSWIQNGDPAVIEENWAAMEKYLGAIEAANPDYLWRRNYGIPFADWLAPEGVTPVDLIATAYWAYDVTLMKQMAHAARKSAEEQKYDALFDKIKAAFNEAFVKPDGFVGGVPPPPVFASGTEKPVSDKPVETQSGYVLALQMNLLPDTLRPVAAQRLVDRLAANQWRLGTGFLGTPYLLGVLTDTGHADVAYRLLLSTEYPSWGYLVEHGATTMWERWNGDQKRDDPTMNSYNHYAYGAVGDWIYRYAAGIDADANDPGYHSIALHPTFDARLGSVDFSFDSPYGAIRSSWNATGKTASWKLTIPPNSTGRLALTQGEAERFTLDGAPLAENTAIRSVGRGEKQRAYELPAGTYQFEVGLP
jgi:alpha-L-rhamnosidase